MPRNYRTMIEHHKENLGSAGDFNSFLSITKENDRYKGWSDHLVIHYLVEDRALHNEADAANLVSNLGFGVLFASSYTSATATVDGESGLVNPEHIISMRARNGVAGTVRLPIKRSIQGNVDDTVEKDGKITVYIKTPDVTANDDIIMRFYVESYGRWVEVAGI